MHIFPFFFWNSPRRQPRKLSSQHAEAVYTQLVIPESWISVVHEPLSLPQGWDSSLVDMIFFVDGFPDE